MLQNIHRSKVKAEDDFLLQLRFACVSASVNGRDIKTDPKVQRRTADLVRQLTMMHPSKEFEDKYISRAGELGQGYAIRVNPDCKSLQIFQTGNPEVVAIAVDVFTQYQREVAV